MRKSISVVLLLAFSVVALVSVHSQSVRVEDDAGFSKVSKADVVSAGDLKIVDLVFIDDATVPAAQSYPLNHVASIVQFAAGYKPVRQVMIRGPTMHVTNLFPRSRDKPTT